MVLLLLEELVFLVKTSSVESVQPILKTVLLVPKEEYSLVTSVLKNAHKDTSLDKESATNACQDANTAKMINHVENARKDGLGKETTASKTVEKDGYLKTEPATNALLVDAINVILRN